MSPSANAICTVVDPTTGECLQQESTGLQIQNLVPGWQAAFGISTGTGKTTLSTTSWLLIGGGALVVLMLLMGRR